MFVGIQDNMIIWWHKPLGASITTVCSSFTKALGTTPEMFCTSGSPDMWQIEVDSLYKTAAHVLLTAHIDKQKSIFGTRVLKSGFTSPEYLSDWYLPLSKIEVNGSMSLINTQWFEINLSNKMASAFKKF